MTTENSKKELFERLVLLDDGTLVNNALLDEFECQIKGLRSLYLDWFDEVVIYKNISRTYVNKKLNAYSDIKKLWILITTCFSDEVRNKENLKEERLASILTEFKNNFESFTDPEPILNYFRIEEEHHDYKVCLSVEPISGIVRLSYSNLTDKGIKSAFLDFMEMRFNMFDIHDALKFDTLDFIIQRTYKMHPKALNNFQLFSFIFGNKIKKGKTLDIIRTAADRQRRFLDEFIPFCKMIYGPDIEGNDERGLEADLQEVEEYDLKYYIGGREYSQPDFSLKIKYTMLDKGGDGRADDVDEISFRLMILYYPHDKNVVPIDKWAHHDIIIDSKK